MIRWKGKSRLYWSVGANNRWWVVGRGGLIPYWVVMAAPTPGAVVEPFARGFWTKRAAQKWAEREDKFYGGDKQ